jgi:hypothetical protein
VDYISKPFDPWVLRAKVAVFVELYAKNRQLQEQAELLRSRLGAPALERGAARKAISAPSGTEPGDAAAPATGEDAGQVAPAPAEQAGPVDTQPLLLELSSRLAAVEDLVGVLGTQPSVTADDVLADCAQQLEHRVGRLRDALDALRVG